MSRLSKFTGLVLVALWTIGCDSSGKKVAKAPVKGTVMLDGKAMATGEISFEVVGAGGAPVVLEIKDGAFSGEANIGKNKVSIQSFKAGPPLSTDPTGAPTKVNFIPIRYNVQSTLEANIVQGGSTDLKFDVTAR